jgi:hypothetical protein
MGRSFGGGLKFNPGFWSNDCRTPSLGGDPVQLRGPRVLIVAENASSRFGGEAILPLHVFRGLRRRGVEAGRKPPEHLS